MIDAKTYFSLDDYDTRIVSMPPGYAVLENLLKPDWQNKKTKTAS